MKITSLVAAAAAVLTLGACSAAPVGLDLPAPSFDLSNTTLTATTTYTTTVLQPTTCTTTATTTTTTASSPTTTSTQLSATGTYAVAYMPAAPTTCPTAP